MTEMEKRETAPSETEQRPPRKTLKVNPTLEPFIISVVGFIVVFILASMFVSPPAEKSNVVAAPTPAPSGLPTTGDYNQITASLPKGNPDAGAQVFQSKGCFGCHGQQKDQRIVGPSFYGLWGRAATRKPGLSAEAYIYAHIVNPSIYTVPGFTAGVMPSTFSKQISPQEMADLLAWIKRDHSEPQ